jgi:MFS family permease
LPPPSFSSGRTRPGNFRLANIRERMPACAQTRQGKLDRQAGSIDCRAPMQDAAQIIGTPNAQIESTYAWVRLWVSVLLGTIGSVGLWAGVVTLPAVQADFGVSRADASLPYTLTMIGFGLGAVGIGRLVDRFGVVAPLMAASLLLGLAFIASGIAPSIFTYALASMAIGVGSSATFAPLIADISHWFERRRGIAVAICASGNYIGGAIWPPIVQHLTDNVGWRQNQIVVGFACLATMLPLALVLLRRLRDHEDMDASTAANGAQASLGVSPYMLFGLLCLAGVACCVAMSMPQVHIVAYCGDLGYGAARGAEMLSLMLGFGIISRIASGFVADRIGGVATLLIGSIAQAAALGVYLLFDGLAPLYVISALFGLFQGGIVPMYAIIVREYFDPRRSGTLVGLVIMSTILGMALGGWMSGAIFDLTGSYRAAFLNGVLWNVLNLGIAVWLLLRSRPRPAYA